LVLIIGILITANSALAIPQGTVIKEGMLTYPAGPYLTENPLLLSLESYGANNTTQISDDSFKIACPEKECLYFYNNSDNVIPENPGDRDLWICQSNLFSIYYNCNTEILHPGFAYLCCSTSSFNLMALSTPLNVTSPQPSQFLSIKPGKFKLH
jgi:hypothetical protein